MVSCFEMEPTGSRTRREMVQWKPAEPLVLGAGRTSRGLGTHNPVAGREHNLVFHSGVNFILSEAGFLKKMCFLSLFELHGMVVVVP